MDAFLKMIDDLQTPKHKTNHIYRSCFPLRISYYNYILFHTIYDLKPISCHNIKMLIIRIMIKELYLYFPKMGIVVSF